jgi:hypothetical protein
MKTMFKHTIFMSGLFLVSAMPSYTQNCIPRLKELLTISKVIINSYDSTSNSVDVGFQVTALESFSGSLTIDAPRNLPIQMRQIFS